MPLSDDPQSRAVQLANLRRGDNPAPAGNGFALRHGGRSEALLRDVGAEVRELQDALADAAPVLDPDGSVPVADTVALEIAARRLKRYRSISSWLDMHGRVHEDGRVRAAADLELLCENALARSLAELGMTPASRLKLLGSAARAFDLAQHWQEEAEVDLLPDRADLPDRAEEHDG